LKSVSIYQVSVSINPVTGFIKRVGACCGFKNKAWYAGIKKNNQTEKKK